MTTYIVHIFREMRLAFTGIEADTPHAAAEIASDKPTDDADNIEDCDGENLSALVDLAGDEDYRHSVTIDFESERIRKAASKLLAALRLCHEQLSVWVADTETCDLSPEDEEALAKATDAIAEAATADIRSDVIPAKQPSRFEIVHDPAENIDCVHVLVDGKFDVAIIRTGEGVVVDVLPRDGIIAIASAYASDTDLDEAEEA